MSTATVPVLQDVAVLRDSFRMTQTIVKMNLDGISHEESLIAPPAGNCLNWVLGHLVCVFENVLPALGASPVLAPKALKRYDRGTPPITNPADAWKLEDLLAAFDRATDAMDSALAHLTPEKLDSPAPFSPRNKPDETFRSVLTLVAFHQAYHSGQLGVLRRVAGKPGAIA